MAVPDRANGSISDQHAPSDTVWNVARCNRLLRPIGSKIKSLRKEAQLNRDIQQESQPGDAYNLPSTGAEPSTLTAAVRSVVDQKDWVYRRPVSGIKRRYGNRSGKVVSSSQSKSTDVYQEKMNRGTPNMNVTTPYIRRIFTERAHTPQSATSSKSVAQEAQKDVKPTKVIRLAKTQHHCSSANGLCQAFEQVLIATKGPAGPALYKSSNQKGARSLFSTCLRSLPKAITEEQKHRSMQNADDKSNVLAEVYNSLEETFELIPGRGWMPFRELVLAQATQWFVEGFEEHLFEPTFIRALLDYCKLYGAFAESQSLLTAFAASATPWRLPRNVNEALTKSAKPHILSCLNDFESKLFSMEFKLNTLAQLVETGKINYAWIPTKSFGDFVGRLSKLCFHSNTSLACASSKLLEKSMLNCCGLLQISTKAECRKKGRPRRDKQLPKTFASLENLPVDVAKEVVVSMSAMCSITCAIALSPFVDGNYDSISKPPRRPLKGVATLIMQNINLVKESSIARKLSIVIILTEFIFVIIAMKKKVPDNDDAQRYVHALTMLHDVDESGFSTHQDLPFITATIDCFQTALKDDEIELITYVISTLRFTKNLRKSDSASAWSPQRLALNMALHYSQHAYPRARAQFASLAREIEEEMQESRNRDRCDVDQAQTLTSKGGVRWEEGICEWVTSDTPVAPKVGPRTRSTKLAQLASKQCEVQSLRTTPAHDVTDGNAGLSEPHGAGAVKSSNITNGGSSGSSKLFDFGSIFARNTGNQAWSEVTKSTATFPIKTRSSIGPRTSTGSTDSSAYSDADDNSIFSQASESSNATTILSSSLPQIKARTGVLQPEPISPDSVTLAFGETPLKRPRVELASNEYDTDSDRDELCINTPFHLRKAKRQKADIC